jgi:hypothetical protein
MLPVIAGAGMEHRACAWCPQPFPDAIIGGRQKLFCSLSCRRAFHSATRRWAEREFFQGRVSVNELNGLSSTCTLAGRGADGRGLLPTCLSTHASPAGSLVPTGGISVLWATPKGSQL